MPLTEDKITSRYSISGYGVGQITINEKRYQQSLVVSPHALHCPWSVRQLSDIDELSIEPILALNPEVILLGTGVSQQFPDARIYAMFGEIGIGLEVMNNGALCRTFNILVAEDRKVVAAIIQGE